MPVRPSPMIFSCTRCPWKTRTHPKSDALMTGDYFDKCPKCGADVSNQHDVAASVISKIKRIIGLPNLPY